MVVLTFNDQSEQEQCYFDLLGENNVSINSEDKNAVLMTNGYQLLTSIKDKNFVLMTSVDKIIVVNLQ